jgi:hypothetical protein
MGQRQRPTNKPEVRLPLQIVASGRELGPGVSLLASAAVVVLLVAACAAPIPWILRGGLSVGIWLVARAVMQRRRPPSSTVAVGFVTIDDSGIARTDDGGTRPLARWGEAFGLTVLANEARARAILAFTTPTQTRYVHVRMQAAAAGSPLPSNADPFGGAGDDLGLLARAVTVADGDLQGDARIALGVADAARVVRAVSSKSPAAFDRIFLTDAAGTSVTVDATQVKVGERAFDLTAPLEWRGFMFHEFVFVAPMPAELSLVDAHPDIPTDSSSQRAIVRDLRLMQSLADAPPPRDLRVAVDRLFMLPLRRALDRAPRVSRPGISTRGGHDAIRT